MAESGRHALVVSSSRYSDPSLRTLASPTEDAEALAELLRNRDVGDFRVRPVVDQPSWVVAEEVERFFADRRLNDIALFYFSGHGIKDEDGALYFATMNTNPKLLRATTVPSEHVVAAMRRCRSRQQVLLLDCCFAGAFSKAMLAKSDERVGVQERFGTEGAGRVVITASDAMQVALEGGQIHGEPTLSVFTRVLVEGIATGKADQNGDGRISIDELYDYVYHGVQQINPDQEPTTSNLEKKGDIVIALRPRADSPPIRDEIVPPPIRDEIVPPPIRDEIVPPPPGLVKRTVNRAKDALRRVPRVPRRLLLALGAAGLAVAVVAVVALMLIDGGASDDWSLADVASAELDGPRSQVLRDVTVVDADTAVAVGSNGTRPGAWTYDGTSWSRQEIEGGSGQMNAVAASGETVIAVGRVNVSANDVDGKVWRRSGAGEWTRACKPGVCGGSGKQELLAVAALSTGEFIAVGLDASTGSFDAAVWLSRDDGLSWERAATDDDLSGALNQVMKGVVAIDDRLVAVGRSGLDGAAWTSDDGGRDWTLISGAAFRPQGRDIELEAVETLGSRVIAVGRETSEQDEDQAAAWFSDARGSQWTRASVKNAHFLTQKMIDVVAGPLGLVAVGNDRAQAAVWQSQDGSEWTTVSSDSFAGPSGMTAVARLSGEMLFAVGTASADGRIWVSEPAE